MTSVAPYPRRWIALITMLTTNFMSLVDVSVVNVALPSIRKDLSMGEAGLQWIVAGFVIALALGLLPMGRMGDIFGRKRIFLSGIVVFTTASMCCGLAPSGPALIAARALQGAGTAMMIPQTLAICQDIFETEERGSAYALFGIVASLAAVSGPALGGAIIEANFFGYGWRPIFWINLPVGLVAFFLGSRNIPDIAGKRHLGLDWVGTGLVVAAMFCLIFALVEGRSLGWPVWLRLQVLVSLAIFTAFVFWQSRQERLGRPQLLPITLMTHVPYALGLSMTTLLFSCVPAFFFTFTLLLQEGFGIGPFRAGLTTLPFPVGIFTASALATKLGAKWPWPRIFGGILLFSVAMVTIRLIVGGGDTPLEPKVFFVPLLVGGFAFGSIISPLFQTTLTSVPKQNAGSASGAMQAMQHTGSALGVSAIGLLFFGVLTEEGHAAAAYRHAMTAGMTYPLTILVIVLCLAVLAVRRRSKPSGE